MAMFRRNLHNGIESELEKLHRRRLRPLVVGLVDGDEYRPIGLPQLLGDALVARHQPLAPVDYEHQEIGADHRATALLDHELVQGVFAGAEHPPGVEKLEGRPAPDGRPGERIARCAGNRRHNRAPRTGDAVE